MAGIFIERIWQPCICQPNELIREIKKKTGEAQRGGKQKSGGGHGPRRPSLRIATGCSVQRIRKNINNLTASKQATITLLDFCIFRETSAYFFLIQLQMQECYIEPDESWPLTLVLQGRLYRAPHPKLWATRNLCMHDFLKFHHNFYACIGVQKERKRTFLTAFEHWEKRLAACLLHSIFSQLSLNVFVIQYSSVSSTAPRYLHWLTNFRFLPLMCQWWGDCAVCTLSLKCHANSFAVVANISMWFCISLTHR